jgi:hypothetical protein
MTTSLSRAKRPLLGDEKFAHFGAGGDLRSELVHLWGVELFCDILAVEQDPLVGSNFDGDLGEVQSLGESQGDGAVHRASVDEKASKAFCQGAGDARLAGASRAINGDLHRIKISNLARPSKSY